MRGSLGAAGALVLASCNKSAGPSSSGPITTLAPGQDPSTLPAASRPTLRVPGGDSGFPSPFSYFLGPGYGRMIYIYDTLLWADATGALLPWLATRWQRSGDGLTYTFELREGIRWHDGRPLTAEDVVFSFQYFARHGATLPPFVIARLQQVARPRAVNERTVEVRLDKPDVTFERYQAGVLPIIPKHIWEAIDDPSRAGDLKVLVGSGPYRLESYSRGQGSYLYVANDEFFLGRPFVKRIEMRPVDDQLTAIRAGELDAASPQPTGSTRSALAPFQGNRSYGVIEGDEDFTVALYWNLAKGGALADPRFRHACARAIDRPDIVKRLLDGKGQPGNPGFLPPGHPFHVPVDQHGFDPAAANRALDEAGYARSGGGGLRNGPDGKPLRFTLLVNPQVSPAVTLVVEALKAIGVELTVDPSDFIGTVTAMTSGAYEMAVTGYGNVSGDPDYMRTLYSSRVQKFFHSARGYVNREMDDLADKQLVTFDEAERKRLVARMQHIAARDLPFLHLYYPTQVHIFRRGVFDQWAFTPDAGFLSNPYNKQVFVTGLKTGGLKIRPMRDS